MFIRHSTDRAQVMTRNKVSYINLTILWDANEKHGEHGNDCNI
jgi:hypothetical protein